LEQKLPEIARGTAQAFARDTLTPELGELQSVECKGPKRAEAEFPGVSLGDCSFVMKNGSRTTTLTGFVSASIVIPGMPDFTKPNDPKTGKPPNATRTTIEFAGASNVFVSDGLAPAVRRPFAFSNKRALDALGMELADRRERDPIEQFNSRPGECSEMFDRPRRFPRSEGVEVVCFSYLAERFNGQIMIGLQLRSGNVAGIRYVQYGGNL
jgi:hypothetical protein